MSKKVYVVDKYLTTDKCIVVHTITPQKQSPTCTCDWCTEKYFPTIEDVVIAYPNKHIALRVR